jgi:tetratricopeptide (TPR) repeat protein
MSYIAPRDPEITPSRLIPIALSLLVPVLMLTAFPAGAATKAEVYGHAKASTVLVVAIDDKSKSVSLGSGFLVNADGLVITNAHVIEDNSRLLVYVGNEEVYTNPTVLAVDSDRDLAALRIPPQAAPALALAVEAPPEGNDVMAVGYPRLTDILNMGFALHPTIVPGNLNGIIQGRSRTAYRFAPFVQVTGHINQGSSGGPLVDVLSGEAIGMVVLQVPYLERARDRSGAGIGSVMLRSGIGYAIPSTVIRQWLTENRLSAEGASAFPVAAHTAPLLPSAGRSFVTGHVLFTIAQVLPKDVDLYNLAVYHYEGALALLPHDPRLLRSAGIAYAAVGRFDDAIAAMTEALDREPASALVAYELGLAQEAKGLAADALITWRSFLDRANLAPDDDGWRVKISAAVTRMRTTMAATSSVPTAIPISIKER